MCVRSIASRAAVAAAAIAWGVVVIGGLAMLWSYEAGPGAAAAAPVRWPEGTALSRAADRPTLVMFLHPHCPCSRASLRELDRALAQIGGRARVHVLFVTPAGLPPGWENSDLVHAARAMPGVEVRRDERGRESARFGALTSGQTLLYGQDGALLFGGGITRSRGHSGDNRGRDVLVALARGRTAPRRSTPGGGEAPPLKTNVFGCLLHNAPQESPGPL